MGSGHETTIWLASSAGSTFVSAAHVKEGEPGIQNHVSDVDPYTTVGGVADRENHPWASHRDMTFKALGSVVRFFEASQSDVSTKLWQQI